LKILHTVQRYYPDSGGSEEVVRQISEHLVSFGHEVTVATGASTARRFRELNGVVVREFACSGNSVQGVNGDADRYRSYLTAANVDIMMNYAAQIWSSDLVFDVFDRIGGKKVFVPCGFSQLRNPAFASYYGAMPDVLRRYDKVIYLSENYIDKAFADAHGLNNSVVIPNGADLREFSQRNQGEFRRYLGIGNRMLILNVSNHSRLKNHEFFWDCVSDLRDEYAFPVLIGNSYSSGLKKWGSECYLSCRIRGIREHATVLEEMPRGKVVEAFNDADVFLFGSKVECSPLVMFEAFAGRTLFVTTNCGNVSDYRDIVCIVRDRQDAVEIIRKYAREPGAFQDRIERGYARFRESLNWEYIARQYESLYHSVLAEDDSLRRRR
jgi:glycosyltransferase involved in cell wall biosynthesis